MLLHVLCQNFHPQPELRRNYIDVQRRMNQAIQVFTSLLTEENSRILKNIEFIPGRLISACLRIQLEERQAPIVLYPMVIGSFLNHYHRGNTIYISKQV